MDGIALAQQVRFEFYEVTTQWSDGDEHHAEVQVELTEAQQMDYTLALRAAVELSVGDPQTLVRVYADGQLRVALLEEPESDDDGDCDEYGIL